MRAEKLVGGARQEVATDGLHVGRNVRHRLHAVDIRQGAAPLAFAHIDSTSLSVPVRLLAPPTQTRRVRSVNSSSRSSRSNSNVSVIERQPLNLELEVAREQHPRPDVRVVIHRERMISSPGRSRRPIERDMCSVIVVMFWPKTISSREARSESPPSRHAPIDDSSAAFDVAKVAAKIRIRFNRQSDIGVGDLVGTCVPAGLSK